ncbi:hypothetical protein HDR58_04400 [bacterium]|nr:hypothetical protein [bacterium]
MTLSEIINIVLAGGMVTLIVAIFTLKSTVRKAQADARKAHEEANKARAEALKAEAEVETVRMDNADHATRILLDNIVKPLKDELNETRMLLHATQQEIELLREAIANSNDCKYRAGCPILHGLRRRKTAKRADFKPSGVSQRPDIGDLRQPERPSDPGHDQQSDSRESDNSEPHGGNCAAGSVLDEPDSDEPP